MKMRETIAARLLAARKALEAADIEPAALDARLLMQAATGLSHEEVVAAPETALTENAAQLFSEYLQRRLAEEPVSRILGRREFYGRSFEVSPAVLDPRADTESLIELTLEITILKQGRLLDVGTGSGAIAVTLLAELPGFEGVALDVSKDALNIARKNALANGVSGRLHFHHGSWFDGITDKFDLIVSNPPYIPHGQISHLGLEVKNFDPHLALDGGADGLFAYRALAAGAGACLCASGSIVLEIGAGQGPDVSAIFESHGFKRVADRHDLGGHLRTLAFRALN
jgi:release factor glutamine methyltransferase